MRAWLAFALEFVFISLAFGLRCWVQYRRTGSTGFILPSRAAPGSERVAATLFALGLIAMVAAPLADLQGLARFDLLDQAGLGAVGVVLAIAGILLCVWAQFAMGASWRIGLNPAEVTDLVTAGPFARVRNPIFSAMVVAVIGLFLIVPNLIAALAVVALLLGVEGQVRWVEEPYLQRVHGSAYDSYRRAAGRFVPGLGR